MCYYSDRPCGLLFSMTNERENKVVSIKRDSYGKLCSCQSYKTLGVGTGEPIVDPLGSQGSIILSSCKNFLFVVNAGSNNITSFRICDDRLVLQDICYSGGIFPNSLTTIGNKLYVTNVGNSNTPSNVSTLSISKCGCLNLVSSATVELSIANSQPGNITINSNGTVLSVSEKATNRISNFILGKDYSILGPIVNPSNGNVPFSSVFINDFLLNCEAVTNAVSSYQVSSSGVLSLISGSITNNQVSVCWISFTPNKRYVYTSNTSSGTVSIYSIDSSGHLYYIKSVPTLFSQGSTPTDSGVDYYGRYFYVLNANQGSISVFSIRNSGAELDLIQVFRCDEIPQIGSQGIAVL